jgi:hypothetical protein
VAPAAVVRSIANTSRKSRLATRPAVTAAKAKPRLTTQYHSDQARSRSFSGTMSIISAELAGRLASLIMPRKKTASASSTFPLARPSTSISRALP